MQLSIIIINYNVKYFLEQCLCSVQKATRNLAAEIFVIDNNSSDGSQEFLQPRFRGIHFCRNSENVGFAKASNQALKAARGQYILFLNPDTIVPEDCFEKCISFFENHPGGGAIGIRMLDGTGKFLKESKRSFPSPLTSFFKLLGLARLFPKSVFFSKYHLGHLDAYEDHEVDVLAGAFMMVKKEVLDKVGAFDENFFMYGEDIDLSYRIQKAGFKNYFFAGSSIIHFKGESTKKGSLNYVRMFYSAMSNFVKKHYGGAKAGIFHFFIKTAIWFRAFLSAMANAMRKIGLSLIDALFILFSFWLAKLTWNNLFKPEINYSARLITIALPVFTLIFLVSAYYAGLYDRQRRKGRLIRSTIIASFVVLAAYSLLPEKYRFSRAIMLLGSAFSFILMSLSRKILRALKVIGNGEEDEHLQTVVVGSLDEYRHVIKLMQGAGMHHRVLGRISPLEEDKERLASLIGLPTFLETVPVKEIIFCEGTLSFKDIINSMEYDTTGIRIRICAHNSASIVGSDSKNRSGKAVSGELSFHLSLPFNRRMKRLIDLIIAGIFLVTFPLHFIFIKHPLKFLTNCLNVFLGRNTWVGYSSDGNRLPPLRKGILGTNGLPGYGYPITGESSYRIDYRYALDYSPERDLQILWNGYQNLGGGSKSES